MKIASSRNLTGDVKGSRTAREGKRRTKNKLIQGPFIVGVGVTLTYFLFG